MPTIRLHRFQKIAFQSTKRFIALIAGTGGGKTFFGPPWLAREIEKYPEDSFLVVAPTNKMLQRTTIPALKACFKGTQYEGEYKETKMQYILPTGGIIYFGTAEIPDSLEGVHVRAAWLDEASLMHRMVWIIIQSRVGRSMGRVLITTTPRAFNWLYYDFYKRFLEGDPDYEVIQFRSIDSPYYPRAEFERMQGTMDSRMFEMRYCGQFRKMSGLVYQDFGPDNIIDRVNVPFIQVRAGVDWGFSNPCAIVVVGIDQAGYWYQVDEWLEKGMLLDQVVRQAQLLRDKYNIGFFLCDPAYPAYIQSFLSAGLNALPADNKIPPGIQEVGMLIKSKAFKITRSCKHTIDELETYHYPEESIKDLPVKENDHLMDALRYAIKGLGESEQEESEEIVTEEDILGESYERVNIGNY